MATAHREALRRLHIPPLMSMQHAIFREQYEQGLINVLFEEEQEEPSIPLHDLYLVDMFTLARNLFHLFDGQHRPSLYAHFGLTLGEIHGSVLSPTSGTVRQDVTTLVTLEDEEVIRGYQAGREFYFTEADCEQEWRWTEERLLERLEELAREYDTYQDTSRTVRFAIGGILGELSGPLFPWTTKEQRTIEAESIKELGYVCPLNPGSIAARQYLAQPVL
ncbi:MAG TPA: hypothetical protein VKY19_28410 [Ktedonosporobacter sp.]|jgi:hypothetical protein|nr:hypothetical protein [Ktedonosporobacter sp.]